MQSVGGRHDFINLARADRPRDVLQVSLIVASRSSVSLIFRTTAAFQISVNWPDSCQVLKHYQPSCILY